MTDKVTSIPIICMGGLDSTQNHLLLDNNYPGKASRLVNYEVGLNGGYARLQGFRPLDVNYPEVDPDNAEGPILGVALFTTTVGSNIFISARKLQGSGEYNFYYLDSGTGWTPFVTGLTLNSGTSKIRHAKFNFGNKNWIIFVDGINNATLTDGTDWYALDSSGTGTDISPGGDQILDTPAYVTVFKNHIFLAGDPLFSGVVCHSAPENPLDWKAASGAGQLNDGFTVNQIKPFRDALYVTGQKNISKITVNNTDFVINPVTTNIGCVAPDSVVEINADLVFLAPDGIRTISATERIGDVELASISKPIQELVNTLENTYNFTNICSVVIRGKSQFRYFISQGDGSDTGKGIIGGLRISDQLNGWEFGELLGIRASVADSDYIGLDEYVIHGDYNGKVYRQEVGDSFDGEPVISIYSTPYLTFGNSHIRKLLRSISTFYRVSGSYDISIRADFDWEAESTLNPTSYVQAATSDNVTYDSGFNYDEGHTYVNDTLSPVIHTEMEGSFFSVRITFSTSDTNSPHTIQGFVLKITPQGDR